MTQEGNRARSRGSKNVRDDCVEACGDPSGSSVGTAVSCEVVYDIKREVERGVDGLAELHGYPCDHKRDRPA